MRNRHHERFRAAARRFALLGGLAAAWAPHGMMQAFAAENALSGPAYVLAQATPSAQAAGEAELKALTEQVLRSLGAATGAAGTGKEEMKTPRQSAPEAAPGDYQALMNALTTLVEKATRQGKSSEDILALIQEALANQDDKTLDALLAQAGGRVGLQKLLRALVHKAALQAAQPDDPYTRMLQAEGEATSVQERQVAGADGDQGRRGIVVQPGDTLSIIALKVYGNVGKWRDIFEANRDRLKDPNLVPAGMRLRLP